MRGKEDGLIAQIEDCSGRSKDSSSVVTGESAEYMGRDASGLLDMVGSGRSNFLIEVIF